MNNPKAVSALCPDAAVQNQPGFNHPAKVCVTAAEWPRHCGPGGVVQEKKDGVFNIVIIECFELAAEKMPNGELWAFDVLTVLGHDFRQEPFARRWRALNLLSASLEQLGIRIVPSVPSEQGAAFLTSVLAAGGEGVCRKEMADTYFTAMTVCKRSGIWTCRVTSTGGSQSVGIADADTGQDRGRVTLLGGKVDQVRVGSIIRVEGMELTEAGKIRQPKPCREWLVKQ